MGLFHTDTSVAGEGGKSVKDLLITDMDISIVHQHCANLVASHGRISMVTTQPQPTARIQAAADPAGVAPWSIFRILYALYEPRFIFIHVQRCGTQCNYAHGQYTTLLWCWTESCFQLCVSLCTCLWSAVSLCMYDLVYTLWFDV